MPDEVRDRVVAECAAWLKVVSGEIYDFQTPGISINNFLDIPRLLSSPLQ
jgi:hypothetical protein